ncbi:MAG: histidine phosphatase family protein [Coriobacteriaceae bacterium]|nr:histidine phosphatase family protein [Coriobacteriaceae bacterium]
MAGTLYFVRHGRTLFNERRIIQGWVDSPLTPEGEQQASRVGRYVRQAGIRFDHAFASTLARTHQTLERITDMSFERVPDLREWSFGEFEGERVELMPHRPWGDFFKQFGGEGEQEFSGRVNGALTQIMRRPGHESVLAVSHGSASLAFMQRWRDPSDTRYTDVPGNCSLARYAFDGEGFTLEEVLEQDDMRRILGE